MLGCSRRDRGSTKKKKKITKQRKFHQVKVTRPFLLNKIMVTSTTKQPRNAQFVTNYRTPEEGLFYINYKTAEEGLFYINYKTAEEGSFYN